MKKRISSLLLAMLLLFSAFPWIAPNVRAESTRGSYKYVVNINSGVFHKPSCASVSRMKEKNKRYSNQTYTELVKAGYHPCQKCLSGGGQDDPKPQPDPQPQPDPEPGVFRFDDVKNSSAYYFDAVYWAYNHTPYQVTAGVDKTHFGPNQTVTRAQAMVFFWAAMDRPKFVKASTQFLDVKKSDWYYKAVMWAVEKGITAGTDATHFSPNKTCNRGEILTGRKQAPNVHRQSLQGCFKPVVQKSRPVGL